MPDDQAPRKNQDLFRASLSEIDPEAVTKALQWLRGSGVYPYPSSIHFNLTLRCTARCVHCSQWTWPAHAELNLAELTELIRIFHSWHLKTITLGGGNPLLHDHFIPLLEMARKAEMQIGIITEGTAMPTAMAAAIAKNASWIRFSLDGPNAEIHDSIRNSPGLFERVVADISSLQSHNSGLMIGLNCVVQKRNVGSLTEMIHLAERLGVSAVLFKLPHGEDPRGRFLLSEEEWHAFTKWVAEHSLLQTQVMTNLEELCSLIGPVFRAQDCVQGRPVRTFYKEGGIKCFTPFFFLTCDSEGNMYPCDYLQADTRMWGGESGVMRNEFCLGNVLKNSDLVMERLKTMMRSRVHDLPCGGYVECGCCTRFCQLNASLTKINDQVGEGPATAEQVRSHLVQFGGVRSKAAFL